MVVDMLRTDSGMSGRLALAHPNLPTKLDVPVANPSTVLVAVVTSH